MKFGLDRYKPDGDWVQTTMAESLVGVQFHKEAAQAFASMVKRAEKARLQYGVQLEARPSNPYDANAIAVFGVSEVRGFFRKSVKQWQIGYFSRDLAGELKRDLLSKGVPIASELLSIYEGASGFLDFKVIILAPKGYGHKVRLRMQEK